MSMDAAQAERAKEVGNRTILARLCDRIRNNFPVTEVSEVVA